MTESVLGGQWFRRYRTFFIIALVLLLIQLLLAYLLPIFGTSDDAVASGTSRLPRPVERYLGARQSTNDILADDEDIINSNSIFNLKDTTKQAASAKEQPDLGNNAATAFQKHLATNQALDPNELQFKPICDIVTKEAISAVQRAQTQSCKETIINITCAIEQNRFYAKRLPNFCPTGSYMANRALGCYKDDKKLRLLPGYYSNLKTLNTPEKCIQLCLQSGFVYAGVQYS